MLYVNVNNFLTKLENQFYTERETFHELDQNKQFL